MIGITSVTVSVTLATLAIPCALDASPVCNSKTLLWLQPGSYQLRFYVISFPIHFVTGQLLGRSANLCASGTYVQSGGMLSFRLQNSGPNSP